MLWYDSFTLTEQDGANRYISVEEDYNGDIISAGTSFTNDMGLHGFLRKYTSDGIVLWTRRLQHVTDEPFSVHQFSAVTSTPDGGYAACGYMSSDDYFADGWVIKVDNMGCLVSGCDTLNVSITEYESDNDQQYFVVGPNPVSKGNTLNIYYVGSNAYNQQIDKLNTSHSLEKG